MSSMTDFADYSALRIAHAIASGDATVEAVAGACLDRIEARDPDIQAWAYLDREQVLAAARTIDRNASSRRYAGRPVRGEGYHRYR
jgi:Asp-tRNA(Asn)/Glu-tRNA(Gln) amidotransferase A subunit family amidase